jgi:hypothetical protein
MTKEKMLAGVTYQEEGLLWTANANITKNDLYTGNKIEALEKVAECELYRDDKNDIWVNNIVSFGDYQRIGVGTEMIKRIIEKYGKVFFSNANQGEKSMYSNDKKNDLRYYSDTIDFKDSNIGLFALSLVNKKIIQASDIRNPFNNK